MEQSPANKVRFLNKTEFMIDAESFQRGPEGGVCLPLLAPIRYIFLSSFCVYGQMSIAAPPTCCLAYALTD